MKKLLLLMLCSIVVYDSYGQVAIIVDETGKITDIKKSTINEISLNGQAEKQSDFTDTIQKNLNELNIKNGLFNDITTRKRPFQPPKNSYDLNIPATEYLLFTKKETANGEYTKDRTRITASIYAHGDATLKRSNADLIALKEYYNLQNKNEIYTTWQELYNIENNIIQLRDYIFNIQLSILNSNIEMSGDVNNNIKASMHAITNALKHLDSNDKILTLNTWMYNTSAISGSTFTMNPLGIISTNKLPLMPDTAKLAANIRTLTTKINKDADYNYSTMVMEQKRYNLQIQLEKIQAYHNQIQQSAILKKQFAAYTILAKFKRTDSVTHYRFHDATDELKLTNHKETKQTIYQNKDRVLIYTYNIPPKGELSYDIKSSSFIQALQFSRLAGGALKSYQSIANTFGLKKMHDEELPSHKNYTKSFEAYDKILDTLEAYQEAIAIYTATIPPADKIEFAKDIDKAYTTRVDELKELQNDSSYKHTYTLGLKVDGKETIKPKTFNFITYKRSRIQFAAGVHFFSGNAPMVVTEGTGFKTVSYNTPRYSAGLKVYLVPQTFADVNSRTWLKTMICSWHMALLVDAAKPLENQYLGIGVDLLPGLGINAGPHFYRYTAYQLYNNAVVGEKKTLKVRDGLQVSLTMDGGLAKDIFTTFLKLF